MVDGSAKVLVIIFAWNFLLLSYFNMFIVCDQVFF